MPCGADVHLSQVVAAKQPANLEVLRTLSGWAGEFQVDTHGFQAPVSDEGLGVECFIVN